MTDRRTRLRPRDGPSRTVGATPTQEAITMDTTGPITETSRERHLVATFVELADTLIEDFDLVEFFAALTERVVQLGIASQAGILLVDESDDLRFIAASDERTELLELFQVQSREGPCQDCFRAGAAVAIDDLDGELERWPLFAPKALSSGFRSVDAVPLRLRGASLGAMNLFHTATGGTSPENRAVVQAMADVATIGLLQQRELLQAHSVAAQLQHALHSRIAIEQAKGIIFERQSLSMDAAFELLRSYARRRNVKLSAAAAGVVSGTLPVAELGT
jgi:GAF domain-containing protein